MSAIAHHQRLEPYQARRAEPLPLAHLVTLEEEERTRVDDFDSWEFHSELVLVDADLRRRSLELCPEPSNVFAEDSRICVLTAPAPELAVTSTPDPVALIRFALHHVGKMTRFGLTVVGLLFTLGMFAELLPH